MNFEITQKQISDLHNAVLKVDRVYDQLEELFRSESRMMSEFKSGVDSLRKLRTSLVDLTDREWNIENDTYTLLRENNNFITIWSIYKYDRNFSMTSEHPYPIGAKFTCYDVYTKEIDAEDTVQSSTWIGLWGDVDRYIRKHEDKVGNHIFIEGFYYDSEKNTLRISLGS